LEIRNRIALVTGGAHRVGRSIALALAGAGAHTLITYLNAGEDAARTTRDIQGQGVRSLAVRLDQRDTSQIASLFKTVRDQFGQLDILVNSAAIMERGPVFDVKPDDWDRVLDINLRGPFFVAQAAARLMLEDRPLRDGNVSTEERGCIVNVADLAALHPWPSYVAHTVSKAGLVALTKALAAALAPSIRVNAIAPGLVLKPPDWSDQHWRELAERTPLRRPGTPDDVAQAVLHLIRSEFTTGQLLVLDGGRELR